MIDNNATFDKYGYDIVELSYGSGRRVVAVCDICGKVRDVPFKSYVALCHKCAVNTTEYTTKRRIVATGKKCSDATRKKMSEAHSGEKSGSWKGGDISLTCDWCGNIHKRRAGHNTAHSFCSNACRRAYNSNRAREKMVCSICEHCGDEYFVHTRRQDVSRFCSTKCRGEHISKTNRGENNPNWRGGASFEPYCEKFSLVFKEKIRTKYERKCYMCNKPEHILKRKLSVHHVEYLKECLCSDSVCDFVPLCDSCHSKTNHNRFFWQTLLTYSLAYEEDYYSAPIPNLLILYSA